MVLVTDPTHQHLGRGVEPHGEHVGAFEEPSVLLPEDHAAGRPDDDGVRRGKGLAEHLALHHAVRRLALGQPDVAHGPPFPGLDHLVAVEERPVPSLRDPHADGGLARAHHADEREVDPHGRPLTAARRGRPQRCG
jgi:hypothetical protein